MTKEKHLTMALATPGLLIGGRGMEFEVFLDALNEKRDEFTGYNIVDVKLEESGDSLAPILKFVLEER